MDKRRHMRGLAALMLLVLGAGTTGSAGSSTQDDSDSETIGHSVEDRPIQVRRIGSPSSSTKVLVVGEIHGDEAAGRPIIRELRERGAPEAVELWLLRDLNPDGLARKTRQNARGVDLNRNFPREWREQGSPGSTNYSGPRPLSEPESRAAVRVIKRVEPDVTVWYHQALEMVDESRGADRSLIRRYADVVGLPSYRLPPLHGNATRWQNHRDPDSSSFVVELAGGKLSQRQIGKHARAVHVVGRKASD